MEALKELENRKYVARTTWKDDSKCLMYVPGFTSIIMMSPKPTPNIQNWLPLIVDFEADDWELV